MYSIPNNTYLLEIENNLTNIVLGHDKVHPANNLYIALPWHCRSFHQSHFSNLACNLPDSYRRLAIRMILDHVAIDFG